MKIFTRLIAMIATMYAMVFMVEAYAGVLVNAFI